MRLFAILALCMSCQFTLAATFEEGQAEVDKENYLKAYEILEPLAQQNDVEAQYVIGRILTDGLIPGHEVKDGVVWLEKAVENQHMRAAQTLGRMYLSGFGVALDTQKGAHYMSLAEDFRPPEEPESECD